MSKICIVIAIAAVTGSALAQPVLVYDNSTTNTFYWSPWDWPGQYSFPYQHGDHLNLAGTNRDISQIDILFTNPLGNSITTDIIVRLYDQDPTTGGALLWTGTLVAEFFINNQPRTVTVPVPNVPLSGDDCTVTYEFTNIQGSPVGVGLQSFYPPTLGTSEPWFPALVGGVWGRYTYGTTTNANFALRIYADADTTCPGDVDGDGDVGLSDLAILLAHFGQPDGATRDDGDLDGDGDVDLADLAELLANFGTTCP
jgi:hypothetical protein